MAIISKSVVISFMLVAAALMQSSDAATHVVLDSLGWIVPPGGAVAYTTWAAGKTFAVGDVLVFNFATGAHDVAEVSKTAYDACTKTSPISNNATGPANVTLTSSGEHYYICTVGSHCSLGQKLAVNVTGTSTSTPSPPGTTTASPPPPASAAAPLAAAALPVAFLSVVLAMFH